MDITPGEATPIEDILPPVGSNGFWVLVVLILLIGVLPFIRLLVQWIKPDQTPLLSLVDRTRLVLAAILTVSIVKTLLSESRSQQMWFGFVDHGLSLLLMGLISWFLIKVVEGLAEVARKTYTANKPTTDVRTRRATTQINFLQRLLVSIIVVVGVLSALLTFPAMQPVVQGLFASAGIISIVAGLAAQTSLTNVFAGMQIAVSDSLRTGDVISIEDQSGVVDDITLSNVVIRLWDDRRLIMPSSYFISKPFENWTRSREQIRGSVFMDVDWSTPLDQMRETLRVFLAGSPLWDGRRWSLDVTDVTGGTIRLQIGLSAKDTSTLFSLQSAVREEMIGFLKRPDIAAYPRARSQPVELPAPGPDAGQTPGETTSIDARS